MKITFGVIDIPYSADASPAKTAKQVQSEKRNAMRAALGVPEVNNTTAEVGQMLEDKYHIMEHFWQAKGNAIVGEMEPALQVAFEDILSGGTPQSLDTVFLQVTGNVFTMFQNFIDLKEMDSLGYTGIPTMAAKKGVNHRLKHPYAKDNPERPSFKDTGVFMAAFRMEVSE
jgi:hypothetical protein